MQRFLIVVYPLGGFAILDTLTHRYALTDSTDPELQTVSAVTEFIARMDASDVLADYFAD